MTTRIWQQPEALVCDLHADGPSAPGTFDGYRMPHLNQPRPDDGLWYARQITTRLDLRATPGGLRARLHLPGLRVIQSSP